MYLKPVTYDSLDDFNKECSYATSIMWKVHGALATYQLGWKFGTAIKIDREPITSYTIYFVDRVNKEFLTIDLDFDLELGLVHASWTLGEGECPSMSVKPTTAQPKSPNSPS